MPHRKSIRSSADPSSVHLTLSQTDQIRKSLAVLCGIVEGVSMRLGEEKTPEAFLLCVGLRHAFWDLEGALRWIWD